MPVIRLISEQCIQCGDEVDLSIDNFILYQAEKGKHYLYCEKCDSPYDPQPNPHDELDRARDKANLEKLSNPWRTLGLLIIGLIVGATVSWLL